MPQEAVFAAPTTEEMTRVGVVGAGSVVTGIAEGFIVSMAPKLGALEVPFTWGTLLGLPALGAAAALMLKGILSDLGLGIAAGGAGVLGYTMPAMLQEFTLARPRGGLATLAAGAGVKQLGPGNPLNAPLRAQQGARVGLEF